MAYDITENIVFGINDGVNDLNHKRENEVMELKNKIDQMQLSNEALIEDYEKKNRRFESRK